MSPKSMGDIGYKQGAEFIGALEKAGFTREVVQQVINSPGNQMAAAMYTAVGAMVPKPRPDKFELLTAFEVTVPENYDHATHLDSFMAAHKSKFYFYNENITDKNFSKVTTRLSPGRKFQVKIFEIKSVESVSSEECIAKIKSENGILVGAQGASLVYEQWRFNLPKGKWYISFDEEDALWFDGGRHRVPCMLADSDSAFRFYLVSFEGRWLDERCLLCFCELPCDSLSGEAQTSAA